MLTFSETELMTNTLASEEPSFLDLLKQRVVSDDDSDVSGEESEEVFDD